MKVMIRKMPDGRMSAYVAKKDLEEPIVEMEKPGMWGGTVTLGNGWRLSCPIWRRTPAAHHGRGAETGRRIMGFSAEDLAEAGILLRECRDGGSGSPDASRTLSGSAGHACPTLRTSAWRRLSCNMRGSICISSMAAVTAGV